MKEPQIPSGSAAERGLSGQRGLTLIEMVLALTLLLPIVLGIVQVTSGIGRTVETNAISAQAQALVQRTFQSLSQFVQAAKMSTLRTQAVEADVAAMLASAVGEWIGPTDGVWRPGIEFVSAEGKLSINARLNTSQRRVAFALDSGEIDNDIDDDGDQLVDEGEIRLLHEGVQVAVVRNVEQCAFQLEGRVLRIRIGVVRRAAGGRLERVQLVRAVYLRNN